MPERASRYGRSVFATVLFVALVVAGWGFVSLLGNTDVVSDSTVGPIVVPVAMGLTALCLFFALAAPRWSSVSARGPGALLGSAAVLAVATVAIYLVVLGLLQFVATGRLTALVLVVAAQAVTPYPLVVLAAAGLTAVGLGALGTSEDRATWPWEK